MKNIIYIAFISLVILSCNKNECVNSEKGRIENNQIDGCGYTIRLNSGDQVEPINLSDFDIQPKHNKKVWVSYHINQNLSASICMVGDIVVIDFICER